MTIAVQTDLDAVDRIEFAAYADMWAAAGPAEREALGLVSAEAGALLVVGCAAVSGAEMLNRVMGVGLSEWDKEAFLAASGALHQRGCVCQVPLRDDAPQAASARRALADLGYRDGYAWMRFIHDGAPVAVPDEPPLVRVRRCGSADAGAFGSVVAAGFGLPAPFAPLTAALVGRDGWQCYLAEAPGGEPVGAAVMFLEGRSAWLGLGATLPAARRRGAQGALLRARVLDAADAECSLVTVETGALVEGRPSGSYRNILRAGFAEQGLRPNLVAAAPAAR